MKEFYVAKSYENMEIISEPFKKENGKLYVKVKEKCPRCGGLGFVVSRVENGQPIPIPVDGGICYKCMGEKYITKTVRAYSKKEYDQMQKANERSKARKEAKAAARKQDLIDNAAKYKHEVALKLGFGEDEKVYLVYGDDTYSVKEELKKMGARFDPTLKWFFAEEVELPEGYNLCSFTFDELYDYNVESKWASFKENAKEIVSRRLIELKGPSTSIYYPAKEKERIRDITARVTKVKGFEGYYGYTSVYTFESENYIFVWMTSSHQELQVGDAVNLTGTIKKFEEYMGERQTHLSRCKVTKIGA